MQAFTDAAGRAWRLSLNIGGAKRVRDLLHVDLLAPQDGDPPLVTRLHLDPILLVDVIYCLLKPQCDALAVTDEQFGESLGGEAAGAAYQAFMTEWQDFFHGLGRTENEKLLAAHQTYIKAQMQRVDKHIGRALTIAEKRADKAIEEALANLEANLESGSGKTSTSSPESLESSPTN